MTVAWPKGERHVDGPRRVAFEQARRVAVGQFLHQDGFPVRWSTALVHLFGGGAGHSGDNRRAPRLHAQHQRLHRRVAVRRRDQNLLRCPLAHQFSQHFPRPEMRAISLKYGKERRVRPLQVQHGGIEGAEESPRMTAHPFQTASGRG